MLGFGSVDGHTENDGWNILEGTIPQLPSLQDRIKSLATGTIVIWEELDRFLPEDISCKNFFEAIDVIEKYLRLFFHRFLEAPSPKLHIQINNRQITALDPFMKSASVSTPPQLVGTGLDKVLFCGYTLPHKDKMTREEHKNGGCIDGWVAHEGFYVYRNNRLLVPGSWLGLGRYSQLRKPWIQDELHQLVRIQLDIKNECDENWKIDIRKSSARAPFSIREELTKLAERVREQARKVYVYRGGYKEEIPNLVYLWSPVQDQHGHIRYQINLSHPVIQDLLSKSGNLSSEIRDLFKLIGDTVPIQKIWLDAADGKDFDGVGLTSMSEADKMKQLQALFDHMVNEKEMSPDEAREFLQNTQPYYLWGSLIAAVYSEYSTDKGGTQ